MAILKNPEEIEIMAEGGQILAAVIEALKKEVLPGITTDFLDELASKLIKNYGAKPAFLGYRSHRGQKPYPKTICASINETIVHGLPSSYVIQDGDLVKLDLGLIYQGFYLDSAITVGVGNIPKIGERLILATKEALDLAIKEVKVGNTLGDIGSAIEKRVTKENFSIVERLTGHGIGRKLHEDPNVLNFGRPKSGEELEIGTVLAIEPMVSSGSPPEGSQIKELSDGSFITKNHDLSAHFEHTIALTAQGPCVLTRT